MRRAFVRLCQDGLRGARQDDRPSNPQKAILKAAADSDVEAIIKLLGSCGGWLDAVSTSTAAHRLAKILRFRRAAGAQRQKRRALEALRDPMMRNCNSFGPQAIANSMWALATLSQGHDPKLFRRLGEAASAQLGLFRGVHLSNLIWAHATLSRSDAPLVPLLSQEAAERAEQRELSPQSIANIVWSHAILNAWHGDLFDRAGEAARDAAADFNAQDLSNTLWAFMMLPTPSVAQDALFSAMATAAIAKVESLPPQDLTSIVWAFAEMMQRKHGVRELALQRTFGARDLRLSSSRCARNAAECIAGVSKIGAEAVGSAHSMAHSGPRLASPGVHEELSTDRKSVV